MTGVSRAFETFFSTGFADVQDRFLLAWRVFGSYECCLIGSPCDSDWVGKIGLKERSEKAVERNLREGI